MKRTTGQKVNPPYSLHDMNIVAFERLGDTLVLRTQSGMTKTSSPWPQVDGWAEIEKVQWEYSYVYLLEYTGNTGSFGGKKMWLADFINQFENCGFSVMDETFGFNQTKLSGYFSKQGDLWECMVEIYHEGALTYVTKE